MRKRSLLARLRTNGFSYLGSSILLLLVVPIYQILVLNPTGFSDTRTTGHLNIYLFWLGNHTPHFIIYRGLLAIAFALLFTMPFSLYRIIVAQEILGRDDEQEEPEAETEEVTDEDDDQSSEDDETAEEEAVAESEGMPEFAWRGKGFAVIAAWAGTAGIVVFLLGTIFGTIYLANASQSFMQTAHVSPGIEQLDGIFSIVTNTVSIGLLAISAMFFGAMIARAGKRLWPTSWIAFGYTGLAVAALLFGSAVGVASTPSNGQALLTTLAIFLFGLWNLWLSIMLIRLKPE